MQITECNETHLEVLAGLFNDYRIFYEQPDDLPAARAFIRQNLVEQRSRLFLLVDDRGEPLAFSQLYPAVCSLAMRPYYYLSDLYVREPFRKKGYARYLMNHLTDVFAREGAQRLTLDTATTNRIAQSLYESLGYEREEVYITYHQLLGSAAERAESGR
ncbi:GNAT family N-acetyltransferase [Thauera sp.]|uniref:GNAT family N-acetyltransferase n=1 Tax=Thauera sp. TaxID=1905334 RepID=UPI0039E31BCA